MTNEKQMIADMIKNMCFERKKPAGKHIKAEFAAMESAIGTITDELNKLHLRLWHAVNKGDYRSLSLEEATAQLEEIQQRIEDILNEH